MDEKGTKQGKGKARRKHAALKDSRRGLLQERKKQCLKMSDLGDFYINCACRSLGVQSKSSPLLFAQDARQIK